MKTNRKTAFIALLAALLLCLCSYASSDTKTEELSYLEGVYTVDIKQYAKDENISYDDLALCSLTFTFTKEGKVTVNMTTASSAPEANEALKTPTKTDTETEYAINESVTCSSVKTSVYTVVDDTLVGDHGVLMGSIKSSKTSKGTTTIKLDTPNGGNKTLKGTLDESGTTFTIDNDENKMSFSYSIKGDELKAEKGVVLGTITDRQIADGMITLTVTAPDSTSVTYTGTYAPELKIGSVSYSYTYVAGKLTLKSTKHTLVLVKQ